MSGSPFYEKNARFKPRALKGAYVCFGSKADALLMSAMGGKRMLARVRSELSQKVLEDCGMYLVPKLQTC